MAYINKETTKKIRDALKAEFPGFKFSVRNENNMLLCVNILRGGEFGELNGETPRNRKISQFNFRHYEGDALKAQFDRILEVIKTAGSYYNNSDVQSDYFDAAFHMRVEAAIPAI